MLALKFLILEVKMKAPKLSKDEIKAKILNDPNFINSPKHNYDFNQLLENNPSGVNDNFAATLLLMTVDEFQAQMLETIKKYRQRLKITVE